MSSARPSARTSAAGAARACGPSTLLVAASAMADSATAIMSTGMCDALIRISLCLRPEQLAQRRKARYLVAECFERGGDRNRQEHAGDAPHEPPEQHAHHDRERLELQPAGIDERRQHVVLQHRDGEVA